MGIKSTTTITCDNCATELQFPHGSQWRAKRYARANWGWRTVRGEFLLCESCLKLWRRELPMSEKFIRAVSSAEVRDAILSS